MKYLIWLLIICAPTFAALNDADRQEFFGSNLLRNLNPGFENDEALWSASGGSFTIASGSGALEGKSSGAWDSNGDDQIFASGAVTVTHGYAGKNGVAGCRLRVPSGTSTHMIQVVQSTAGNATLHEQTITQAGTNAFLERINFIFPSQGEEVKIRLLSTTASEPEIIVDDCFIGDASEVNISNISQAQAVGFAYFATTANCGGWSRTNTAIGAFASDADCPGPTVANEYIGDWQTTDADLPKWTINSLPPGRYFAVVNGSAEASGANAVLALALTDGSVTVTNGAAPITSGLGGGFVVQGFFEYTTAGNRTFELYGSAANNTIVVNNGVGNRQLSLSLVRYPLSTEQVYKPDTIPFFWGGRHQQNCSFTRTAASYADMGNDASCTFTEDYNINAGTVTSMMSGSNFMAGIVFTPQRVGLKKVCATVQTTVPNASMGIRLMHQSTTSLNERMQHSPTSTVNHAVDDFCGTFNVASLGTGSVTISIQAICSTGTCTAVGDSTYTPSQTIRWRLEDAVPYESAPLLVNSVVNPRSAVTQICSGYITNGGTPSVTREDGDCVSALADNGTGDITVTFSANTFSSTPNCTFNCVRDSGTGTLNWIRSITSSTVRLYCGTDSVGPADLDVSFMCIGPR